MRLCQRLSGFRQPVEMFNDTSSRAAADESNRCSPRETSSETCANARASTRPHGAKSNRDISRCSRQSAKLKPRSQNANIMRLLVLGLVLAILVVSLAVLGSQVLEQSSETTTSEKPPLRIPFTRKDLEDINANKEASNSTTSKAPTRLASWYSRMLSPFATVIGPDEPEDELSILIGSEKSKSAADRSKPRKRIFDREAGEPEVDAARDTTVDELSESGDSPDYAPKDDAHSQAQVKVQNTHEDNNRKYFEQTPTASLFAVTNSSNASASNYVATIDKIKGIDLAFSKMVNDADNRQQSRLNRDVKCNKNKYDRLIAQKILLNEISRPVITSNGRFDNPFPTWSQPSVVDALKFMVLESDESSVPKNKEDLERELPLVKPDFIVPKGDENEFKVTWIGHSTLVIQIDGLNILTDPIFSDRASPTQFFGPKRIRDPACKVEDLPRIDAVIISHNHYDHLDADSVKDLNRRFGSDCRWIVPLGLGDFMKSMSVDNYIELDWWQRDCFIVDRHSLSPQRGVVDPNSTQTDSGSLISGRSIVAPSVTNINNLGENLPKHQAFRQKSRKAELSIYLTPSQHWSRRGVNDVNKSLWGSYTIVSGNDSTFFFGGDTAYCAAFTQVAKVFGPITGAAIPVGAYKPRWFLKTSHVDPHEAVQIHRDLKSSKSMAIHHSTFILSNEHYREPTNILNNIMNDLRVSGSVSEPFISLNHGQSEVFRKLLRSPKL